MFRVSFPFLFVLCLLAPLPFAYIDLGVIPLGSNATVPSWGVENATYFVADISGAQNTTVEIFLLRRQVFGYTASAMSFCRLNITTGICNATPVAHNISLLMLDEKEDQIHVFVNRTPSTYDTDVPIQIFVCDGHCELECPTGCSGHGACNRIYKTCSCDHHYNLINEECIHDLTGGNNGVVVAVIVIVVVVVLVLVGLCFWGCEGDGFKKKEEVLEKKDDGVEVVEGDGNKSEASIDSQIVSEAEVVEEEKEEEPEKKEEKKKKDKKKKKKKTNDDDDDEKDAIEMTGMAQDGDDGDDGGDSTMRKRKSGKKGK